MAIANVEQQWGARPANARLASVEPRDGRMRVLFHLVEDPAAERARFSDDATRRVASGAFVRSSLPVYDHGTGAFVILGCPPGPADDRRQVFECGEGETRVTHPDFRAWLQDHVEELELRRPPTGSPRRPTH